MDSNSNKLPTLDFNKFVDYDDEILTESELTENSGEYIEYWNEKCEQGVYKRSDSNEFSFDEDDFVAAPTTEISQGQYLGLQPEQEIVPETTTDFRFIPKHSRHQNDKNVSEWLEHLGDHQWSDDGSLQEEETETLSANDPETLEVSEEATVQAICEILDADEAGQFVSVDADAVDVSPEIVSVDTDPPVSGESIHEDTEIVNVDRETVTTEIVDGDEGIVQVLDKETANVNVDAGTAETVDVDTESGSLQKETESEDEAEENQDSSDEILDDDIDDTEEMNRRNSTEMMYDQFERNQWRSRSLQMPVVSSRDRHGHSPARDRGHSAHGDRHRRNSTSSSTSSNNVDNGNMRHVSGSHGYHGNDPRMSHEHHNTPRQTHDGSDRRHHRRRSGENSSARQPLYVERGNKSAFTKMDNSTPRLSSGQHHERKHRSRHEYDNLHHKSHRRSDTGSSSRSSDFADIDFVPPRASTPQVGRTCNVTLYRSASPIGDDQIYHHGNRSYDRVPNPVDSNYNQVSHKMNRTFPPSLVLALDSYRQRRERSRDREMKSGKDSDNIMKPTRCASPSLARGRRSPVVEVIRHSLTTVQAEDVTRNLSYDKNRFHIPTFSEFKEMRKLGMLPEYDDGISHLTRTESRQRQSSHQFVGKNLRLDLARLIDTDDFQSSSIETSPRSSKHTVDSDGSSPVHTPRIGSGKREEEQRVKDIRRTNALRQKVKQNGRRVRQNPAQKHESENTGSDEIIGRSTKDYLVDSPAEEKQSNSTSRRKKSVEHQNSAGKPPVSLEIQEATGKTAIIENVDCARISTKTVEKQDSVEKVTKTREGKDSPRKPTKDKQVPVSTVTTTRENQDSSNKTVKSGKNTDSSSKLSESKENEDSSNKTVKSTENMNSPVKTTKSVENQEPPIKATDSMENSDGLVAYQDKLRQMKEEILGTRAKLLETEFGDFDSEDKIEENCDNKPKADEFLESDDSDRLPGIPVRRRLALKQKRSKDKNQISDENQTREDEVDTADPIKDVSNESLESDISDSDTDTCRENIPQVTEPKKPVKKKSVGSIIAEYTKNTMLTKSDNARVRQEIQELQSGSQDLVEQESRQKHRDHVHVASIVSVSSVDSGIGTTNITDENKVIALPETKQNGKKENGVVRNDSGVGSENGDITCEDCRLVLQLDGKQSMAGFTVCRKCEKRRVERKETIMEIVQTEISYGDDLRLILQEFFRPIKSAALLSDEQLDYVFLNIEELEKSNDKLADILQDALDLAAEEGDEDYTTVNFGKLLKDNMDLFDPFEEYCINQAPASVMLSTLESEKELLRVFLEVSQKENIQLRKLHLKSFLMAPVQRITKYPLLLSRLHKTTPEHNEEATTAIKEAQTHIEKILEHINAKTQRVVLPTGGKSKNIRRSFSNLSLSFNTSVSELKKLSLDTLGWNKDNVKFLKIGRLQCSQPTDQMWQKVKKSDLQFKTVHVLLVLHGENIQNYKPPDEDEDDDRLQFPRNGVVRQGALVIFRDRTNEKFTLHRDPLMLDKCVVSSELGIEELFEVIDMGSNDITVFKTDNIKETGKWIRYIRHQTQNLGGWRRRRNALANIMITSMVRA